MIGTQGLIFLCIIILPQKNAPFAQNSYCLKLACVHDDRGAFDTAILHEWVGK